MIAIHHTPGSYSDKWIEYCEHNSIDYQVVNCFDSNIIEQLEECNALMWHWIHYDLQAQLFARQLIFSLEKKGLKLFPDSKTCWHYDDKVGQKYLLEAINAPLVPTHIFYDKHDALEWTENTEFPKVFKTRNGAGSHNVKLIKNKKEAYRIIRKAFGKGISTYDKISTFKDSIWKFKRDKTIKAVGRIAKYFTKLYIPKQFQPEHLFEKNYAYFQNFIPDCEYDYRMKIIGDRCWGLKRFVRDGDFRASGSGLMDFDPANIPEELVKLCFEIVKKLELQSVSFDFVERNNAFFLIEISYASGMAEGQADYGYWDSSLNWHKGKFVPEYLMIEDLLNELKKSNV